MEVAKYYSASFCCRPKPLTCYKNLKSEIYILDIQPFMVIGLAIARLDRRARIQFGQVHFGVFSTSRFAPLALSSDWILILSASALNIDHHRHRLHCGLGDAEAKWRKTNFSLPDHFGDIKVLSSKPTHRIL